MKITISQQNKKLLIEFFYSDVPRSGSRSTDLSVGVDKADDFLAVLDRFIKKRKIDITVLKKANLEFIKVSILTERIIKAIIAGLRF